MSRNGQAPHAMGERIIIADDHPVFRDGMRRVVERVFPDVSIGAQS